MLVCTVLPYGGTSAHPYSLQYEVYVLTYLRTRTGYEGKEGYCIALVELWYVREYLDTSRRLAPSPASLCADINGKARYLACQQGKPAPC